MSKKLDDIFHDDNFYEKDGYNGYQVNVEYAKKEIKALMLELIGEPETTYKYDVPDKTHQIVQKNLWKQELRQRVEEL